jgi:hypothetical protein
MSLCLEGWRILRVSFVRDREIHVSFISTKASTFLACGVREVSLILESVMNEPMSPSVHGFQSAGILCKQDNCCGKDDYQMLGEARGEARN